MNKGVEMLENGPLDDIELNEFSLELENDWWFAPDDFSSDLGSNYSNEDFALPLPQEEHGFEIQPEELSVVKTNLHPKEDLYKRRLLKRVHIMNDFVFLELQDEYNSPRHYKSISNMLQKLYDSNLAFQEKFERPTLQQNEAPCLKLKSNHGYPNENAVYEALISFGASKKKFGLREALAEGRILEGVEIKEDNVKLVFKNEYRDPRFQTPLYNLFYKLYRSSEPFQEKFKQPRSYNGVLRLRLQSNHGYPNELAVLNALTRFGSIKQESSHEQAKNASLIPDNDAETFSLEQIEPPVAPSDKRKTRKPLSQMLPDVITRVEMKGDEVVLVLKDGYNNPKSLYSINKSLRRFYDTTAEFSQKFEQPKYSYDAPCLTLKPNHGYTGKEAILEALLSFFIIKERFSAKKLLAKGCLLKNVVKNNNTIVLVLRDEHNLPTNYSAVNESLIRMYKTSKDFRDNFRKPYGGTQAPTLVLMPNHKYVNEKAILDALVSFAAAKIEVGSSNIENKAQHFLPGYHAGLGMPKPAALNEINGSIPENEFNSTARQRKLI